MKTEKIAFKVEELEIEAATCASLLLAINEAIFRGGFAADEYEFAMALVLQKVQILSREIAAVSDTLFADMQADRKGAAS